MDTWKKQRAVGIEGPFEWENTPLAKYVDESVYDASWGVNTEREETTAPWLIWDPPQTSNEEEPPEEVRFIRTLEEQGGKRIGKHKPTRVQPCLEEWNPFRDGQIGFDPEFNPARYFGRFQDKRDRLESTAEEIYGQFSIDPNGSVPVAFTDRLQAIRNETRARLEHHGENVKKRVMRPLRNVLIPCVVEGVRANGGFVPPYELSEEVREKQALLLRDINHLWDAGIGAGMPIEALKENDWFDDTLKHVPNPVAEGAKIAFHVYVESNSEDGDEPVFLKTRDDILERARPVYFKWRAACFLLRSALYDWTLSEALEKMTKGFPDIFEGSSVLRIHAAEIVEKYRSNPGSLPEGRGAMGNFKENWVPDSPETEGYSKVQMIQREIQEAGLSDEYSDGNPESFCELVERLVERHDTARS